MTRRKPASGKQHKAELQLKRAIKRGDLSTTDAATTKNPTTRGSHSSRGGHRGTGRTRQAPEVTARIQASRRLQSAFVKLSPEFLEEAKRKASELALPRPIPVDRALFPTRQVSPIGQSKLSVIKRPKWNYEMSKKQVEANEEGMFKKWLEQTDATVETWRQHRDDHDDEPSSAPASNEPPEEADADVSSHSGMPTSAPLYERNIEVWRQLWRVTEICQILLILLDSRCPLLHYPQSLHDYLSSFREPRKVIFVLTKVDISGAERSGLWQDYLHTCYPEFKIVKVESYQEKEVGAGQGKRKFFEPHIPSEFRANLVDALKSAHDELCTPPPSIQSRSGRASTWRPKVTRSVDWDAVLEAGDQDISNHHPNDGAPKESSRHGDDDIPDYVSVGLIGQPNVGKSSLLNALFGSHKVKASKTPGKTKHFQTLFWTNQIRLVDCPGLVFPNHADMEFQVLAGILPISQIPAIPSTTYLALQYIPLEEILKLEHPGKKEAEATTDKRTWRSGMQRPAVRELKWTAMDVLTAFAEKQNWITAKAGRPDVNRAGNAILRAVAEGRIKWAFYPPDYDVSKVPDNRKSMGIWIDGSIEDEIAGDVDEEEDGESSSDESSSISSSESSGSEKDEEEGSKRPGRNGDSDEEGDESERDEVVSKFVGKRSMFSALTVDDGEED